MKHLLCAGMNKRGVPALVPFLFFLWWGDWTWLGGMALTHHDAGRWSQLPMSPAGSLAALGAGGPGRGTPAESRAVHREEDAWGAHCVLFSLRQGQVDEAGQRPHPQSPAHRPREGMGGVRWLWLSPPLAFMLSGSTLTQSSHCTDWHSETGKGLPKVTQQTDRESNPGVLPVSPAWH